MIMATRTPTQRPCRLSWETYKTLHLHITLSGMMFPACLLRCVTPATVYNLLGAHYPDAGGQTASAPSCLGKESGLQGMISSTMRAPQPAAFACTRSPTSGEAKFPCPTNSLSGSTTDLLCEVWKCTSCLTQRCSVHAYPQGGTGTSLP